MNFCNFEIFYNNCYPYIINDFPITNLSLHDVINSFEKASVFGLELNFMNDNELVQVNYSPSLSSIELYVSDVEEINTILNQLSNNKDNNNNIYNIKEVFLRIIKNPFC